LEVVKAAWHCPIREANPLQKLDWLFRNTARFLNSWNDRHVGNIKHQLEIAKEVVLRLEMEGGCRPLASHEEAL
jgi:hypothetical protein